MTTIVCLSPYSEDEVRALAGTPEVTVLLAPEPPAPDALRRLVPDADIVIGDIRQRHRLDRDTLARMKHCRLIQQPSAGFDAIDARAAAGFDIPVANGGGHNQDSVADWVIMAMISLLRHGARRDREMHQGSWPVRRPDGRELGSVTVGIIGMGKIGRRVADRLRGFRTPVLYSDIVPRDGGPGASRVTTPELLERADIVTVHVPLDDSTRHLIGADELSRMRPGALLVNASRGPVLDEAALTAALESGQLGGAALDVFETEPLRADSPLRSRDDVFLTPHIGGASREAAANLREAMAMNIRRALAGQEPRHVVNGLAGAPVPDDGSLANGR